MKITRVDRNNDNTPVLYNHEIDQFAHNVLADYNPDLLSEPGIIDYEHFLESYLGMKIMYKDLYYEKDKPPIYGTTVFRDGTVKVFDRKNNRIAHPIIRANTVIIDNFVIDKKGMEMFTGLHESGHIFLHQGVYSIFRAGQACCRKGNIGTTESNRMIWTAEHWREHQANYFAAAAAMPNATFKPLVNEYLREHGIWKGSITLGIDNDLDLLAKHLLPEYISEVYGVSKSAAFNKLKSNDFIQKQGI
jgi:Zn-dependent peptidase ImmA (M78 family)